MIGFRNADMNHDTARSPSESIAWMFLLLQLYTFLPHSPVGTPQYCEYLKTIPDQRWHGSASKFTKAELADKKKTLSHLGAANHKLQRKVTVICSLAFRSDGNWGRFWM